MAIKAEMLVFVYGTLLRSETNHHLMKGARLVSERASVSGVLYNTGRSYPAMVIGTQGKVKGELYQVTESKFRSLDKLEVFYGKGDPRNEYERVRGQVITERGVLTAWVYVYPAHKAAKGRRIPSGDWRKRRWRRT